MLENAKIEGGEWMSSLPPEKDRPGRKGHSKSDEGPVRIPAVTVTICDG